MRISSRLQIVIGLVARMEVRMQIAIGGTSNCIKRKGLSLQGPLSSKHLKEEVDHSNLCRRSKLLDWTFCLLSIPTP